MGLFGCKGCDAKDDEIKHLLAQIDHYQRMLDTQQKRILELAQPGATYRMEHAGPRPVEPKADAALRGKPRHFMPGYEPDPPRRQVEIE